MAATREPEQSYHFSACAAAKQVYKDNTRWPWPWPWPSSKRGPHVVPRHGASLRRTFTGHVCLSEERSPDVLGRRDRPAAVERSLSTQSTDDSGQQPCTGAYGMAGKDCFSLRALGRVARSPSLGVASPGSQQDTSCVWLMGWTTPRRWEGQDGSTILGRGEWGNLHPVTEI